MVARPSPTGSSAAASGCRHGVMYRRMPKYGRRRRMSCRSAGHRGSAEQWHRIEPSGVCCATTSCSTRQTTRRSKELRDAIDGLGIPERQDYEREFHRLFGRHAASQRFTSKRELMLSGSRSKILSEASGLFSRDETRTAPVVTEADLERELMMVRSAAASEPAGVFGPDSVIWRIDREAAVLLGAGRALLLQLAHPWVAAAIAQHSRSLTDPIGRFHRTFSVVFTMVFGTTDQALSAARRLHRRHTAISGTLREDAGAFAAGSPYCSNDVAALRWVHATLTDTALLAYQLVNPPMSAPHRER